MKNIFLITLFFLATPALAKNCLYSFDKNSVKVTWTGFKYTKKAAVSGTFASVSFKQTPSKSLKDLYKSLSFEINTTSINSGNPGRDASLQKTILGFLKVPTKIEGKATSATDSEINFNVSINENTPIKLGVLKREKSISASGRLNLLGNGLQKSFDLLKKACEKLHIGDDGVSKTWPFVNIKIEANYEEKCSKGLMDSIKSWFS